MDRTRRTPKLATPAAPKQTFAFRHNTTAADAILRRMVTVPQALVRVGELVAAVVDEVNTVAPASWELTLRRTNFFLNVGQVAVLVVNADGVSIYTSPVTSRPQGIQEVVGKPTRSVYKAVRMASQILRTSFDALPRAGKDVERGLRAFARRAAEEKSRSPWKSSHSPAAISALAAICNRAIEQPGYVMAGATSEPLETDLLASLQSQQRVERAAIRAVSRHYQKAGYSVKSVERENLGYDLHCTRGREVRRVEVKGLGGGGRRVILTRNEWDHRKDRGWWLAIVSYAGRRNERIEEFSGQDLTLSFEVEPLAYSLSR